MPPLKVATRKRKRVPGSRRAIRGKKVRADLPVPEICAMSGLTSLSSDILIYLSSFVPWATGFSLLRSSKRIRDVLYFANNFYKALALETGVRSAKLGLLGVNYKTLLLRRARDRAKAKSAKLLFSRQEDLRRKTTRLVESVDEMNAFEAKHRDTLFGAGVSRTHAAKAYYDFEAGAWVPCEDPFALYHSIWNRLRVKVLKAEREASSSREAFVEMR